MPKLKSKKSKPSSHKGKPSSHKGKPRSHNGKPSIHNGKQSKKKGSVVKKYTKQPKGVMAINPAPEEFMPRTLGPKPLQPTIKMSRGMPYSKYLVISR